ncbi:hypothetical protein [Cyclobacterium lianum]|uniref:hypothetical protein n=1 Tax=Cyclobacterium lianum TaxID=388280 RepID=UPI001160467F|nr:hypothetical protein [Cyclobacterium lianum]
MLAGFGALSCDRQTGDAGPLQKLNLELADSIVVDELEVLAMDDYLEKEQVFLMRGTKSRKPYLVSETGEILQVYDLLHEGPDGLGSNGALGYSFLDKDQWVAQGLFNGYHVYNSEGKKTKLLPPIHTDIFAMSIYTHRIFFRGYIKAGRGMLIGQEQNLFNPEDIMAQLRSGSGQYYNSPEFKAASKAYIKPYYLLVEKGEQIGVLDGLPVHGALDFADENGFIYVNDNLEPEAERAYNVFYKFKISGLD